MRKIASLAAFLALAAGTLAEDVKVRYVRPSEIITFLANVQWQGKVWAGSIAEARRENGVVVGRLSGSEGHLVPKGITLLAHDSKGILEINGPADGIAEVKRYVALFDVQPAKVRTELEVSCPTLNTELSTSADILNNRNWLVAEDSLRLQMALSPRVNDDGTVTIHLEVTRGKSERQSVVIRVKKGQKVQLRFGAVLAYAIGDDQNPPKVEGNITTQRKDEGDIDEPELILNLKASLVEKAESPAKAP